MLPETLFKYLGAAANAAVIPTSFKSASSSVANLVPPAIKAFAKAGFANCKNTDVPCSPGPIVLQQ